MIVFSLGGPSLLQIPFRPISRKMLKIISLYGPGMERSFVLPLTSLEWILLMDFSTGVWAVCHHVAIHEKLKKKYERLVKKTADGICKTWCKTHFNMVSEDLWEERMCFPDMDENFTYSLAAVQKGLFMAHEIYGNGVWLETATEIAEILKIYLKDKEGRSFGKLNDDRIDASMLGLLWPFNVNGLSEKIKNRIVETVEDTLVKDMGVYRYEHDEYDGWMYNKNIHRRKGSGYWPLLNFWMAMAQIQLGNKDKAEQYFFKVLDDLKDHFIPEQIFNNKYQVSVSPLCWSHAMFVIVAKELGLM